MHVNVPEAILSLQSMITRIERDVAKADAFVNDDRSDSIGLNYARSSGVLHSTAIIDKLDARHILRCLGVAVD